MQNNALLYSFGMVFLLLALFSPIINNEFNNDSTTYDTDGVEDSVMQQSPLLIGAVQGFSALFFWVFGLPFWLNAFLTMMRLIFWVIVYDKFRGI